MPTEEICRLCGKPVQVKDATKGETTWRVCAKCGVQACSRCIPRERCPDCKAKRPKPSNEPRQVATTLGSVKG